ncbi:hypothetical protein LCI18_002879 [Fusarium solani-melongenae]|uniref:Uncharacterized protein n=1 Tax=Fusarium solani subsp. cucurbitae TaxID=2747967 RepID=A0ACD3YSN3_FUSSC|nr:hypothetical protein LCI18_002879 [Fusarium solani-melongenae]
MGFDCDFDIYPRLEVTPENKAAYQRFLDEIIDIYKDTYDPRGRRDDGKVLEMPTDSDHLDHFDKVNICFMVGECPHMPSDPERCNYFLRFSSKVSGGLTTPAEPYIRSEYKIAKEDFGSRVHSWHELRETGDERQWGWYDWQQIHDAEKELRELKRREGST